MYTDIFEAVKAIVDCVEKVNSNKYEYWNSQDQILHEMHMEDIAFKKEIVKTVGKISFPIAIAVATYIKSRASKQDSNEQEESIDDEPEDL